MLDAMLHSSRHILSHIPISFQVTPTAASSPFLCFVLFFEQLVLFSNILTIKVCPVIGVELGGGGKGEILPAELLRGGGGVPPLKTWPF